MEILRLRTVEAFIAFDLDGCATSAGGTRMAPDVTEREAALLARAMTYKFAVLGIQTGGAKGAIRHGGPGREEKMKAFCEEIRPLVEASRFLTGPDLGTSESDFAPLRGQAEPGIMTTTVDGVPFEDVLTGFGVVAAAEAALGPLEERTVAIEGFGKVGGGVAREATRRGAGVAAVSTLQGCVLHGDVDGMLELRARHGDGFVHHLGVPVLPPEALFEVECDVLVPGARTGVIDPARAERVKARAVVPAANVPFSAGAPDVLHARGITAPADFVCNAGAVIGYVFGGGMTHDQVLKETERRIGELVGESMRHPGGPFAGACAMAEQFLRTWWPPGSGGPPVA